MEELPGNWAREDLESCVEILDNKRIPVNADERANRQGNVPYYGATGQAGWIDDFIFDEELVLVGEDGAPFFEKEKNVAFMVTGKSWVNNHAHVLKAIEGVTLNSFVLHYLNHFDYTGFVGGTTRLKLTQGSLKKIPFPLPPLPEQKRIVAKLDTLFGHLDQLKARLENIPTLLKQFRQAVLTQAVTGKLTEEWRRKSKLTEWETSTIGDVLVSLDQGWSPKCENFASTSDDTWAVIKTTSVQDMNFLENENKQLPTNLKPRKNLEIQIDDLLITRAGPRIRVGICCHVKATRRRLMICDKVYRLRFDKTKVLPAFIEIIINSPERVEEIDILKTGISDSGLNLTQTKIKELVFSTPSLIEQKEIIQKVESLFALANRLEARYETLQENLDQLPQAMLAKAFRGEFVEQEINNPNHREQAHRLSAAES